MIGNHDFFFEYWKQRMKWNKCPPFFHSIIANSFRSVSLFFFPKCLPRHFVCSSFYRSYSWSIDPFQVRSPLSSIDFTHMSSVKNDIASTNSSRSSIPKPSTDLILQQKLFGDRAINWELRMSDIEFHPNSRPDMLDSRCLQLHKNHWSFMFYKTQFQRSGHQSRKKASCRPVVLPSSLSSASAWFSCITRSTWGSRP